MLVMQLMQLRARKQKVANLLTARVYSTETETLTGERGKLTLNLVVPHEKILAGQVVTQVNVTTADGEVGILADHVPSVEQLLPGVLEVFGGEGKDKKYFGMQMPGLEGGLI